MNDAIGTVTEKLRWLLVLVVFCSQSVGAAELPAIAEVFLIDQAQQEVKIADVTLSSRQSETGQSGFVITMDYSAFNDHFLSMRPFKCIEGPSEWLCHLPYPYETRATISTDDLIDLEYQLLFIRKTPSEFGIDAWNGLYYQLTLNDDNTLQGQLLEGDLNVLASPPAEQYARPVDLTEFIDSDPTRRLFPGLVIREKEQP